MVNSHISRLSPSWNRLLKGRLAPLVFLFSLLGWGAAKAPSDDEASMPQPVPLERQENLPLVIEGEVVDTSGKALAGAEVAVLVALSDAFIPPTGSVVLAEAVSGNDGGFRISTPSVPLWQRKKLWAVARHPGHALAKLELDDGRLHQSIRLKLGKARSVRGLLTGPEGKPIDGARIRLLQLTGDELHVSLQNTPPFDAWPPAVHSRSDGTFEVNEIPASDSPLRLTVEASHADYATQQLTIDVMPDLGKTPDAASSSPVPLELQPLRIVRGVVVGRDHQEPIADAWMQVVTTDSEQTGDIHSEGRIARTDVHGRFECRCTPGKNTVIYVYPPPGSPYPAFVHSNRPWPEGDVVANRQIEIPRGIKIDGRVADQSGKPVEGAILTYWVQRGKSERLPQIPRHDADMVYWASEERRIVSDADGAFQLAVLPGPGYLLAKAPSTDFLSRYISVGEVVKNEPGGFLFNVEAALKISPAHGTTEMSVTVELQRGGDVELMVRRPDGQPVSDAILLDPHFTQNRNKFDASSSYRSIPVRDGTVTVRGVDRCAPKEVYILDVENQLGTTVSLTAADCDLGRRTIELQPCGSARAQLVDEQGKPLVKRQLHGDGLILDTLLIASGMDGLGFANWNDGWSTSPPMRFVNWRMTSLDKRRHRSLETDSDGFVTFPTLIPGADYLLTRIIPSYRVLTKIKPNSGAVVDLGPVVVTSKDLKRP